MTCSFCGCLFEEASSVTTCDRCPLHPSSCGLIKCPNCGYEVPREPKVLRTIRRWLQKRS